MPAMANRLLELWATKHKHIKEERNSDVDAQGVGLSTLLSALPLK